ncbi:MAG: helix-turn-helix domain-containing protein [Ignavibacteriales bacterium]
MITEQNKLGNIIREYRRNFNISSGTMAEELGVSSNYLEELEQGYTEMVSLEFLNRLVINCNIPVQYILDSVKGQPEMAMWLAVQNMLKSQIPEDSLQAVYIQVMAILNKLGEIWLQCPSVEDISIWNTLLLRNIESLYEFVAGWKKDLPKITYDC